jgi:hypothetical protein
MLRGESKLAQNNIQRNTKKLGSEDWKPSYDWCETGSIGLSSRYSYSYKEDIYDDET